MSGILSLLRSRKFWTALGGVIGVVFAQWLGEENADAISTSVVTVAVTLIGAIAAEDAAAKLKSTDGES